MKSPQLENGYTRIANELVEQFCKLDISNQEYRVLMAIIRLTYGFKKKEAKIRNKQIVELTGISKQHVYHTMKKLISRLIVAQTGYFLRLNKNYDEWIQAQKLPKQATFKKLPKQATQVAQIGYSHIYKENIKEKGSRGKDPLRPMTHEEIYTVSERENVSFKTVLDIHKQILQKIADGNTGPKKINNLRSAVNGWLSYRKNHNNGESLEMDELEAQINRMSYSPEALKLKQEMALSIIEQEKNGTKKPAFDFSKFSK